MFFIKQNKRIIQLFYIIIKYIINFEIIYSFDTTLFEYFIFLFFYYKYYQVLKNDNFL